MPGPGDFAENVARFQAKSLKINALSKNQPAPDPV
jgi:hypothetical protein